MILRQFGVGFALAVALGMGWLTHSCMLAASATRTYPGALAVHATIESIGIVAPYTGDDDQNNSATVRYRPAGASDWLEGPEMFADRSAGEWRVSLVHCLPGTQYEIEVRYTDPDGAEPETVLGIAQTRPDYPDVGSGGKVWYVPDDGDLQAVINAASAGDTVRIRGGTYYTGASLEVENSGMPGGYLTIEAVPGERVVLDGSDPSLNNASVNNWIQHQGSIYYTDLPWADTQCEDDTVPYFVHEQWQGDGRRYLSYLGGGEWDAFLAAPPGKAYYDCGGRLYVVTYGRDDPDRREMHVSRTTVGLNLQGADYVRIRNLEFRYYQLYGVLLRSPGADYNIIEGSTFHGNGRSGIRIGKWGDPAGANNLIQDNSFYEHGYRDSGWTWRAAHDYAPTAGVIASFAGSSNVIRRNTFAGGFDGVDVRRQTHNTDVYQNVIQECMDDGIEVDEQPGYNTRVWGNTIRYCYSGISNQDWFSGDYWNTGPVYIFRNVIEGGDDPQGRTDRNGEEEGYVTAYAFKVGGDEPWTSRVYYYHNTISIPDSSASGSGVQDAGGEFFSGIVARNNLWSVTRHVYNLRRATAIVDHDMDCNNLHNAGTATDTRFIRWSSSGGPTGDGEYRTLSEFQAYTNQDLNSISNNGTVFNPDLSLAAGSPEIDAGCVIVGFNDRGPWAYLGDNPDIGAFEFVPVPDLSSSIKTASQRVVSTGDTLTYTVHILNTGIPLTSTVVMTDRPPVGLDFLPGTLKATLGTAWVQYEGGSTSIHWQGLMSDTMAVAIRYGVRVVAGETLALENTAWIDDHSTQPISRSLTILVNPYPIYLPVILHEGRLSWVWSGKSHNLS